MEREQNKRYNDDYISKELMMQYQDDLHDMLDDLSQPNQSMTISNLSAISQLSPFRNNYGNAFGAGNTLLSGLTSHRGIKIRDVNESGSLSSRIPGFSADRPMTDRSNDDNFQKIFQKKKQDYFQKKLQRTSEDITDEDFEISADTAAGFSQFRGNQFAQTKQRVTGQDGTSDSGNGLAAKNRTFADEVMLMGMVENQGMRTTNILLNPQNVSPHKNLINGGNKKSFMNLEEIRENNVDQKAYMKGPMQCEDLSAVSDNLGAAIDADGATVSHNNLTNLDKSDLYGGAMSDISGLYPHKSPFLMRFDDDAPSTPNGADSSRRAQVSKNQFQKDAPQTLFGQIGNENKKQKTLQSFHSPSIGSANQNKRKQSTLRDENLRESFQNNFQINNLQDAQIQIESLTQKLETEKLLSQCLKKEIQEVEKNYSDEIQAVKEQSYQIQQDLTFKLQQMDGYIRQILEQYNQKEGELDKITFQLKESNEKISTLEKENFVIKTDLVQFTSRCQALEKDLRGRMNAGQQQEIESYQKDMEFQLKKLSEQSQKQISQLKEEKVSLQQQLKESQIYLKQLKGNEDLQVTLDIKNQQVERFTVFYSNLQSLTENSQTWLLSFQEGLSNDEIDQQMFLWVQRLVQIEQQEQELIAQLNNLQKLNSEFESIVKSQQQSFDKQNQEIISLEQKVLTLQAQAQGPSSFTKSLLLEKDKLIEELNQRIENLSQELGQFNTTQQEEKDQMKLIIKQKEQEVIEQRQKYEQQIKLNQKINEDLLKSNEEYLKKIKEHSQTIHNKPLLQQVEIQVDRLRENLVDQNTETEEVLQIEAITQVNFFEDQEIQIVQQQQKIQKYQLELDTAYQQISSLEEQVSSFNKGVLDDQNQQQQVLESQKKSLELKLQKFQLSLDDLENKNLGLQKELSIQNKQLESKEKLVSQLKTELLEIQTKAKSLNNQLVQEKIKTEDAKRAASSGTLNLQKAIEEQYENKWKKEKEQLEKEHHNLLKTQITEQIKKSKEEMNQLEELLTEELKTKFKNDIEQEKKSLKSDLQKDFENKYQKDLENQQKQFKSELQTQFEHTVRDKEQQWKIKFQQIESEVQNMVNQHQQELTQQSNKFEEELSKLQVNQKVDQKQTTDDKNFNFKKESEDLVKILKFEFDKILLSLKVKSQNLSQEQLNQKRQDINKKIKQILTDTDQAIAVRLWDQMEEIKRQISEILKLFKDQLEAKSKKKESDLNQKIEELNNHLNQLQSQVSDTDRSNQEIIKLNQLNQQQKKEIEDFQKQIEQLKLEKQEQPQQNQVLNVLQQILANQQKNVPETTKSPQNNTQRVPKLIFNSQINKVNSPCPIPKQKLTSKVRQDAFSDFDNHELHLLNHQKFLRMQQVRSQNTFLNSIDQAQVDDDYYQENNNQYLALDQSIEQDNQNNYQYQSNTHQQQEDYGFDPIYADQSAINISQNHQYEPIKMNKKPSRIYTDQGRKQGNIEQDSSQSSVNNLVNFDSISQDQAVDLLAKVFQKLGVNNQQPFSQILKAGVASSLDGMKRANQKNQQFLHNQQKKMPIQAASGGSNRTAYRQLEILQSISQAGPDDHLFQMENQNNVTAGMYLQGQYNLQHDTSILSGGPNQFGGRNNIGSDNVSQNNIPNTPSNFLEQRQGRLVQNGQQYQQKQQQQLRIFPQDSEGDQEDQHRSQLDFYYAQETEETKLNPDGGSDQEELNENEQTFPAGDVFIRQAEDLIKRFGSQQNIKDNQQRNEEVEDRPLKTAGKITPFGKQGRFGSASQSRADDSIVHSQSKTNNHVVQQLQNKIQSLNFRSIDAHPTSGQIIKNLNLQLPSVNSSMMSKQVNYGSVQQPWNNQKGKTAKLQNMTLSADIESYKRVVNEADYQKLSVKAFRSIGEEQFLNNRNFQQNTIDPNELGSLEIMRGNYQEINMDETIDEGIISKNRYPSMEHNDQKETIQLFDCRELQQSKDGKVKQKGKQNLLPRPPRYQTDQQEEFDEGSNTENHYDSKIKAGAISRKQQVYRSLSGRMVKQISHNAY